MAAQMGMLLTWVKCRTGLFTKDENGDFGIGQIAGIVAGIVIIGVVISTVTGRLPDWIDQVWEWISGLFSQTGTGG